MLPVRTRFAPSPTGDLHLGGALTALADWWLARNTGGTTVLRVEDLDRPRVVLGAEQRQTDDLAWLGLDWDERPGTPGGVGPFRQSERGAWYDAALDDLARQGRTYLCDCSRAEIARVASAPHDGDEVLYPGFCRDLDPARPLKRRPAVRLRVEAGDAESWADGVAGPVDSRLLGAGGDFVLRRGDGVYAYQLAVAVDDLAMGITGVVRGADLVPSTPRQLLLMRLWQQHGALSWARSCEVPRYWHLPLVRGPDGARLAKRTPGATLRELRAAGVSPADVVGRLAHALGLTETAHPVAAADLAHAAPPGTVFRAEGWSIPRDWSDGPRT